MGIDALTRTDAGEEVIPSSREDWQQWVSATATRNHVLGDPLLDWLDLYGKNNSFEQDNELSTYDPRTDFMDFVFKQGSSFEAAVLKHLKTLVDVVTISNGPEDIRSLEAALHTFDAMRDGAPVIYQGVLRDAEHRTYGAPDLLIRSDILAQLFPDALDGADAALPAPGLGSGAWHYRIVDVKFTTLDLAVSGVLSNDGSSPAYKVQLFTYNRALGRLQGFEPDTSFLLGRGWRQEVKGVTSRVANCMDRLGPVPQNGTLSGGRLIADAATEACTWVRDLRSDGSTWGLVPTPARPELYPDAGNQEDGPWHVVKRRIADELEELTLLWQVGVGKRRAAHDAGIFRWRDPRCTPAVVGVTGPVQQPKLQALLDVNRATDGSLIRPLRVHSAEGEWRTEPALEFYVDFETVTDLADDFSRIPERGGQAMIFMIGCGHIEKGEWQFECFIADDLTEMSEATIIDSWLAHMRSVQQRIAPEGEEPRLMHWSHAEVSFFETAYNSAKERQPDRAWPSLQWFDFLKRVVKEEPVVVRGAMGFGLKAVAKAMHAHGFIETLWADGPADGLGAMAGAWWCEAEARRTNVALSKIDLMQTIAQYNEVDCRVIMEAVCYLRLHH